MKSLARWLFNLLFRTVALARKPDFVVGAESEGGPYLQRWYMTPWRRWQSHLMARAEAEPTPGVRLAAWLVGLLPNAYLHCFLRDDDDRALHDHPWPWLSFLLAGTYIEHTIAEGGIHQRAWRHEGSLKLSGPRRAHRIELLPHVVNSLAGQWAASNSYSGRRPCWTLFITGPRLRRWGFHCPEQGWIDFARFTRADNTGETGAGCDA